MSEAHETGRRGRAPRSAEIKTERRARRADTLDKDVSLNLSIPREFASDKEHNYRWVNDRADRIQRLVDRDYDLVHSAKPESSDDDRIRRVVGENAGHPQYAYLMRQPKDFAAEDEAKKMAAIRDREQAIVRKSSTDQVNSDGVTYTPAGNSISQGYAP